MKFIHLQLRGIIWHKRDLHGGSKMKAERPERIHKFSKCISLKIKIKAMGLEELFKFENVFPSERKHLHLKLKSIRSKVQCTCVFAILLGCLKGKWGKCTWEECPPGATGFSPKMGANSAASLKLVTRDCKYCQAPNGNTNTNTL